MFLNIQGVKQFCICIYYVYIIGFSEFLLLMAEVKATFMLDQNSAERYPSKPEAL